MSRDYSNRIYKKRLCLKCGAEYQPTGSQQKWCSACVPEINREQKRKSNIKHGDDAGKKEKSATRSKIFRLSHPNYQHEWDLTHLERRREICRLSKRRERLKDPEPSRAAVRKWTKKARANRSEVIRLSDNRHAAKRRLLGFIPLNVPFEGSVGHHLDKEHVMYVPEELHRSVKHNVWTGENMDKINELARRYA